MQTVMSHATLKPVLDPLLALRAVMRGKALMRLKYEGKDKAPDLSNPDSKWHNDPEGYAEDLFAYYECFKCKKPYYGGERVCGEAGGAFDPTELVCGGCSPWSGDIDCPKHGKDFIEFKCRFCCSVAVRDCPRRGSGNGVGGVRLSVSSVEALAPFCPFSFCWPSVADRRLLQVVVLCRGTPPFPLLFIPGVVLLRHHPLLRAVPQRPWLEQHHGPLPLPGRQEGGGDGQVPPRHQAPTRGRGVPLGLWRLSQRTDVLGEGSFLCVCVCLLCV